MKLRILRLMAGGIILSGAWLATAEAESLGTNSFQRPAWLTEASLTVKESYDNNVFESGVDNPPPYTLPPGSVAALKDVYSWVTAVSPKVDVNFAPLMGDPKMLQSLSLAYTPDFVFYHDANSETYNAQKFTAALKAKTDAVSICADNNFSYVDGSHFGPVYPGGLLSAFATVTDRERREQVLDKASAAIQFTRGDWFFRPTAALYFQNMMTAKINSPGYQNYADRYDVNGGADAGYKITSALALTLGYRYGHQDQEQFSFTTYSSPNDYQRVLFGMEGGPWNWLDLKIQLGPDFRRYEGDSATHLTPVNDLNQVNYFGEALITAKISSADTLTFKYKQWQWLSTLGKVPYYDSTYDLSYHRKLTRTLGFDLGGRILDWNFNSGNLPTCHRNDLQYTATAGLAYAINPHLSVSAACCFDLGRNAQSGIQNPAAREFDRQLFSLAAQCKF